MSSWQKICAVCEETTRNDLIAIQITSTPNDRASRPNKGRVLHVCPPGKSGSPPLCLAKLIQENTVLGYRFQRVHGSHQLGGDRWSPEDWTAPGVGDPGAFG